MCIYAYMLVCVFKKKSWCIVFNIPGPCYAVSTSSYYALPFSGRSGLGGRASVWGGHSGVAHAVMALARGAGSSVTGVLDVDVVDARSAQADHLRRLVAQTEATGRAAQPR